MKQLLQGLLLLALVAVALYVGVWRWGFCRFYVEADQMAIVTAKEGSTLPAGQILAEKGQKGVQREVLGEGRHFRNPYLFDHEIRETLLIPAGKVGIVLSKVGKALPQGEFLARGKDEQGIWRQVLGPGRYRLNPHGYEVEVVDAISIPIGYAGVMTSLSGTRATAGAFATADQKGVREEILQPGLYYINPRQYKVDVLEIGINQVSLLGREGGRVVTKSAQITQNVAMNELQSDRGAEQAAPRLHPRQSALEQRFPNADGRGPGAGRQAGRHAPGVAGGDLPRHEQSGTLRIRRVPIARRIPDPPRHDRRSRTAARRTGRHLPRLWRPAGAGRQDHPASDHVDLSQQGIGVPRQGFHRRRGTGEVAERSQGGAGAGAWREARDRP